MLISFLSINVIVGLGALYFAYGLFKDKSISTVLITSFLIYFSQITISILVLGVIAEELRASNLYLLNLAISMLALPMAVHHRISPLQSILQGMRHAYALSDWTARVLLLVFGIAFALLLVKIWYLPPHVWDVFMYHLTPAVEWYQQERIIRDLPHVQSHISQQALGMTLLNFWYFVFLGRDTLMGLPQVIFSGLLVLTVYGFLRDTTRDFSLAVKFSIVTFFVPFVLMQADTAKDHIGLSVSFFIGVFCLWKLLAFSCVKYLFPASLAFGLMAGFKMGAIIQLPIAVGLFIFYWMWTRDVARGQDALSLKGMMLPGALALLPVLLLAGYWYLPQGMSKPIPHAPSGSVSNPKLAQSNLSNSLSLSKPQAAQSSSNESLNLPRTKALKADMPREATKPNSRTAIAAATSKPPVSPFQTLRYRYFQDWTISIFYNNVVEIIPRIFDYRANYTTDLIGISGYGPQFAAFAIPVLLYMVMGLKARDILKDNVLFLPVTAVATFIIYSFVYENANSYRLLSFTPFMLIPTAGYLVHKYDFHRSLITRSLIDIILVFCALWSFTLTFLPHYETNLLRLREFVSLPMSLRTSARYTSHYQETPSLYLQIENIPPSEPIAYISSRSQLHALGKWAETWTYPFYDTAWKRKLYSLRQEQYLDCRENVCRARPSLRQFLNTNGVSFVATCRTNWCFAMADEGFIELARGLYYYQARR